MDEVLILRTVIDNRDSIKGINQLKAANKEIKKALEESGDVGSEGFAAIAQVAEETGKTFDDVKEQLSNAFIENRQEVSLFNRTMKESGELGSGSILEIRESVKTLTREYDALDEETRNGAFGADLREQISAQVESLKELEGQTGRNQRNVGNYDEAIGKLGDKFKVMGVSLNDIKAAYSENTTMLKGLILGKEADTAATVGQTAATTTATAASGGFATALKVLKFALAATGIGLIVIALGGLVAAFGSTQRGADAFARVLEPIKFVIQRLIGIFQEFSFDAVDGIKKSFQEFKDLKIQDYFKLIGDFLENQLMNRLKSFGVIAGGVIKVFSKDWKEGLKEIADGTIQLGTGVTDATDKIGNAFDGAKKKLSEISDELAKAAEDGRKYIDTKIALEEQEIKLQIALEESKNKYAQLREQINNQNLTDIQRIKASQLASAELQRSADLEKSLINKRIQLAELENAQNDTDRSAQLELSKLKASLIALDTEALLKKARLISQETGLIEKLINTELKRIDAVDQLTETTVDKLEREKSALLESLGLREQDLEALKQNQADILEVFHGTDEAKKELQETFIESYESRNQAVLKIEKDFNDKLSKLALEQIEKDLDDRESDSNRKLLILETEYFKKLEAAKGNQEAIKQIELEYGQQRLEQARTLLEDEIQVIQSELEQLTASSGEMSLADSILNDAEKEILKERLLEIQNELAKTSLELSNVGTDADGNKFDLLTAIGLDEQGQERLNESIAVFQNVLSSLSQAFNNITEKQINNLKDQKESGLITQEQFEKKSEELEKKNFERQKRINIAATTANYLQGLVNVWSAPSSIPQPYDNIPRAIMSAFLTATFGTNISKIKSQKFSRGGELKGPSHSGGGIKTEDGQYEFEGDEGIINKRAMRNRRLRAVASYANSKTGGVKFGGALPEDLRTALDRFVGRVPSSGMVNVRGFYAAGGAVPTFSPLSFSSAEQRSASSSGITDQIERLIRVYENQPASQVAVTEINDGQSDVSIIESKSENG